MTLKKALKYMVFTLLYLFLFIPNVNASTKYLLCEYTTSENDAKMPKLRYIFKDGTFEAGGGQKNNSKGSWNRDEYKDVFDSNSKKIISQKEIEKCPKTLYYNQSTGIKKTKKVAYSLSSGKSYTLSDLKCSYKNDNEEFVLDIKSTNSQNQRIKNAGKCPEDTINWVKTTLFSKTDISYINNHDWQAINNSWYYLQAAGSSKKCPSIVAKGYCNSDIVETVLTGGYSYDFYFFSYTNNKEKYFTRAMSPRSETMGNDKFPVSQLACNSELVEKQKQKLKEIYNQQTAIAENLKNDSALIAKHNFINDTKNVFESFIKNFKNNEYFKYYDKNGCKDAWNEIISEAKADEEKVLGTLEAIYEKAYEEGTVSKEDFETATETIEEVKKSLSELVGDLVDKDNLTGIATDETVVDCTKIFGSACDKNSKSLTCFVTTIFNIIKIIIAVLLIVLGSIDFAKVVISNEKEAMSKALSTFVQRIIIAIAIFLLPIIIDLLIKIYDEGTDYTTGEKINCIIESLKG